MVLFIQIFNEETSDKSSNSQWDQHKKLWDFRVQQYEDPVHFDTHTKMARAHSRARPMWQFFFLFINVFYEKKKLSLRNENVRSCHTISNGTIQFFMFIKLRRKKCMANKRASRWNRKVHTAVAAATVSVCVRCWHNRVWHEEAINVSHIICAIKKENLPILTSSLLYKSLLLNI